MFQASIPIGGYGGWRFLQATFDRQLDAHSASPQIRNDRDYMVEKLSGPVASEDFLSDRRLLRVALTAFGLGDEAWKTGFIRKVVTEAADPESTFLQRLNNPRYTAFADAFRPEDQTIRLTPEKLADMADRFERASFETAVGTVNNDMRLSLNFQSEIATLVGEGSREDAILYRLLGDVPVRTVLEGALNLPSEMRSLAIEKQADILSARLSSALGVSDLSRLKEPELVETVLQRFHAGRSLTQDPSGLTRGATALALLQGGSGFGGQASQNLFASLIA